MTSPLAPEPVAEAEQARSLYGSIDGQWLILTSPLGSIPPPTIAVGKPFYATTVLAYLGPPADVVRQIYNHFQTTEQRPQERLAALIGVTQQSVSRYAAGTSEPYLSSGGWSCLVRQVFQSRWGIE